MTKSFVLGFLLFFHANGRFLVFVILTISIVKIEIHLTGYNYLMNSKDADIYTILTK